MNESDPICADHLPKRTTNSIKKPGSFSGSVYRARARVIVDFSNQMREHFGVRFGTKVGVAAADELIFQFLVFFDHPVVNQRQLATGVEVRMRVFVGDLSMRRPACMADAE